MPDFGNFTVSSGTNLTDVNVQGISNKALDGLYKALQAQAQELRSVRRDLGGVRNSMDDSRDESDRNNRSQYVQSVASERRQRAANAAVFGKIDKGIGAIGVLKDTFINIMKGLTDIIAEGFNNSLRSFQEFSKVMRNKNLTSDEKAVLHNLSSQIQKDLKEKLHINAESSETNEYLAEIMQNQKVNPAVLKDSQRLLYAALRHRNVSEERAYQIALSGDNSEEMLNALQDMSDFVSGDRIAKLVDKMTPNELSQLGGANKAFIDIAKQQSALAENSVWMNEEASAYIGKVAMEFQNGLFEYISDDKEAINSMLAMVGGDKSKMTPEFLASSIREAFANNDIEKIALFERILTNPQNKLIDPAVADSFAKAAELVKSGNKDLLKVDVRGNTNTGNEDLDKKHRDANVKADEQSSTNGLISYNIDSFLHGTFGSILGPLSDSLDMWFGDRLSIDKIVSNGFKTVCTFLFTMAASDFIKKGFSALKGILTSALGALGIGKGASDLADTIDDLTDAADDLSDTSKKGKAADAAKNAKKTPTVKGKGKLGRIGNAFSKTKTALGSGLGKIAGFLKNGWGKAKGFFGKAISKVGSLLSAINPFKGGAGGFLSNIFSKLGGFFKSALSKAGPAILKLFTSIGPKVLSVFSKLLGPIGWAITAVQGGFSLGEVIANKLLPDGVKLVEKAGGYINSIKQIGQFIATETSEFFTYKVKPMFKSIGEFFSSVAKSIGNFFTNTIPKFFTETAPNAISSLANSIGDFFSNAISNIEDYFYKDFVTPVSDFFKDIYKSADEYFISPISNFFEDAKEFAKNNFIDPLKKFFDFDWAPKLIRNFVKNGTISKEDVLDLLPDMPDSFKNVTNRLSETVGSLGRFVGFYAEGGVVNKATPAVVGEDGKEAILPLEKPGALRNVLSKLTSIEKQTLIKELLGSKSFTVDTFKEILTNIVTKGVSPTGGQSVLDQLPKDGVPGDDQATINRILSYAGPYAGLVYNLMLHGKNGKYKNAFNQRKKWYEEAKANAANQEGRDLIRGTYAERALDYGVSELGKPYILRSLGKIGYVCNELVNACISASGFNMGKFRVHGVKATFANIQKGKYSGNEYPNFRIRDDLTPETAMPGMVFFQDARKNREGGFQPGHIGLVYYGHQKLHSSGGSSNYTKEGFLPNWQTPCRGVTVTPFDNSNYVIGEFPGLFEKATNDWKLPKDTPIPFGPSYTSTSGAGMNSETAVKKVGLLTDEELNNLAKEAGVNNAATLKEFIKQAEFVMNSNKDKDSVITILLDIAKYLRGAVTSSKPTVPVARPVATVYG